VGAVDHPDHYNWLPCDIECIDVIEHLEYNLGAAMKYIWRCGRKDAPIQELEKAVWYLQREIERRKKYGQYHTTQQDAKTVDS